MMPKDRWERNRRHWEATTDAQNLAGTGRADARRALALAETADIRRAFDLMEPLAEARVLALGDGPALAAVLMARRGARVVVADISLPRVREGRRLVQSLGLADRVTFVVASSDSLPFADAAFDRITTKSVLIHTRLAETSRECARVLAPRGVAAFVEPTPHNPFVRAYRATLAPAAWRDITTYFGAKEVATVRRAFADAGIATRVERWHFLGFFASVFAFALSSPMVYSVSERVLVAMDGVLFKVVPGVKRWAWFVIVVGRRG